MSLNRTAKSVGATRLQVSMHLKRTVVLGGVGFAAVVAATIVAAKPFLMKSARASRQRTIHTGNAPAPIPLLQTAKHELQSSSPALPQKQTAPGAEAYALQLWSEFEESRWGASLQDWSSLHANIPCETFRGNIWSGGADRQWSHRCSGSRKAEAPHWSFYVFGLQEPLIARLEQFDVTTSSLPEATLALVQSALQTRLAARYGLAEDRSPRIAQARTVLWPEHLLWKDGDLELQLNLSEFDPKRKEGRLQLQARHRALLEALNQDARLNLVGASGSLYEVGSGIDKELAEALRSDFPDVANMLVKQQPDPDPQKVREAVQQFQNQLKSTQATGQTGIHAAVIALPQGSWKPQEFYDALVRLMKRAKSSPPERKPVLLLASDRLARRLYGAVAFDDRSQMWRTWRTQLADLGVKYEQFSETGWTYRGDLLHRVWADYGETDWGERAFLLLLRNGWDTDAGLDCGAGSDQFREVIRQGLPFLEKHPKSPYRFDVQLALAQGYETWWSLSQAPTPGQGLDDGQSSEEVSDANPLEYQEGAESARRQAISRYEELLQTAPQSDHAAYARRQLPRLKLRFDTGQRRFYCSNAD